MAPVTHRGSSDRVDPSPGCTFSVVICTRNRAAFLADAIRSVLDQQYPKDRYELLVVDNGSCDATRAVVESHLHRLPRKPKGFPFRNKRFLLRPG